MGPDAGDLDTALSQAEAIGVAYLRWHGLRLDVFVPSIDFYDEALRTRVRIELPQIATSPWPAGTRR